MQHEANLRLFNLCDELWTAETPFQEALTEMPDSWPSCTVCLCVWSLSMVLNGLLCVSWADSCLTLFECESVLVNTKSQLTVLMVEVLAVQEEVQSSLLAWLDMNCQTTAAENRMYLWAHNVKNPVGSVALHYMQQMFILKSFKSFFKNIFSLNIGINSDETEICLYFIYYWNKCLMFFI